MMVSYIVPVYNGSASIGRCIQHILDQRGDFDREIIVVDDGSTDNTVKIVQKYPVNLHSMRHRGASVTRNYGISKATGDYIAMVDADTLLDLNWTQKCFLEYDKNCDILQTTDLKFHEDVPRIRRLIEKIDKNPYISYDNLLGFIGNGTFLSAKNRHLIQYDPMYIVGGEDIDLLFNLIDKKVIIKMSYRPAFFHKHVHRSKKVKYLSFVKKKIVFAYGNIRTFIKHPHVEYARRDAKNNILGIFLYPFIWFYKKITM